MNTARWSRITFACAFLAALVLLESPALGLLPSALIGLAAAVAGRRPFGAALLGLGVGIGAWLGQAQLRCALAANCVAPDVTPWFSIAAVAIAGGALLLLPIGIGKRGNSTT